MAINLHEKYSKKVQERFYQESLTESSFSKSLDVEFTGVKTVKVSSIDTVPMNDYTRSGSSRYGTPTDLQDTIQEFVMTQDRSFTFIIDKGDNLEQNLIKKAAKTISRQLREVVTPEIDTYRFTKWAEAAGLKVNLTAALTEENILKTLITAKVAMDKKKVPAKNRTLYIGAEAYEALLGCKQFLALEATGKETMLYGDVGRILGMKVSFVPEGYLPDGVAFMIVLRDAAISPMKLHEYKIHKDPPGYSGHLCEGRFIYDAFVLDTKKDGIYVANAAG